jgi:Fic-DOC domain mobile mystery protein B
MGLNLEYYPGQTPLDEDEKEGLAIPTIATRRELDEFEQLNIEEAVRWMLGGKFAVDQVLDESFIRRAHKRMLGQVWRWAGTYRSTNKNLGVDKYQIPLALRALCDDTRYWIAQEVFTPDEIALRFKHRLVSIHCFPNGNGRHSRLLADLLVHKVLGQPLFSWGAGGDLIQAGDARLYYLQALRAADRCDMAPLLRFARS